MILLHDESPDSLTWNINGILEESSARQKSAARRGVRKRLEARGRDMAQFDAQGGREESGMDRLSIQHCRNYGRRDDASRGRI